MSELIKAEEAAKIAEEFRESAAQEIREILSREIKEAAEEGFFEADYMDKLPTSVFKELTEQGYTVVSKNSRDMEAYIIKWSEIKHD